MTEYEIEECFINHIVEQYQKERQIIEELYRRKVPIYVIGSKYYESDGYIKEEYEYFNSQLSIDLEETIEEIYNKPLFKCKYDKNGHYEYVIGFNKIGE